MSNPILSDLLRFFAEQGLTLDILAGLPEADLNKLQGPGKRFLNSFQKSTLQKGLSNYRAQQTLPSTPRSSDSRIKINGSTQEHNPLKTSNFSNKPPRGGKKNVQDYQNYRLGPGLGIDRI